MRIYEIIADVKLSLELKKLKAEVDAQHDVITSMADDLGHVKQTMRNLIAKLGPPSGGTGRRSENR